MNFIIVFWTILDCKRVFHLITVITNNKLKYKMIEFLFSVITLINTYITITLYDLLFLLIISF